MFARALPLAFILLAGCARSEDASVAVDMNVVAPDIVSNASADEEITAGAWRESTQNNSTALEFLASDGAAPQFSLRCGEQGGLILQRHGVTQAGGSPALALAVGRERRDVAAALEEDILRASLTGGDSLIAALGAAATPIGVRAVGVAPLLLPPGPAVNAFVGRCMSTGQSAVAAGNSSAETATEPAANAAAPAEGNAVTR
ncbi:MAG: hypothetical protein AB7O91_07000 [Sphingomonas sp.]